MNPACSAAAQNRVIHGYPVHCAEDVGGVEADDCGVVVCTGKRELKSRSNKKVFYGGPMNDPLEANKRIVREWHELAIDQRKPEEAVAKYLGPHYRQHNPGAGDGAEPFIETVKGLT